MNFEPKSLAIINLGVQVLLIIVLAIAAFFSLKKEDFITHCRILRIAVPVQILTIALIMLPALLGYLINERKGLVFNIELLVHAAFGIIVIASWFYANLVVLKKIPDFVGLPLVMFTALASWIVAFLIGINLYVSIW